MRVFLQLCLALEGFVEGFDHLDLVGREGEARWQRLWPITGLDELDDDDRRPGRNGHELFEPIGGLQLTVLDLQPLALHRTEQLLDGPPQLVPSDDLPGVGGADDLVRGEQIQWIGSAPLGG